MHFGAKNTFHKTTTNKESRKKTDPMLTHKKTTDIPKHKTTTQVTTKSTLKKTIEKKQISQQLSPTHNNFSLKTKKITSKKSDIEKT